MLAEAVAKAAVRSEGIAALLILATLAAQDSAAANHCDKQKVHIGNRSFLLERGMVHVVQGWGIVCLTLVHKLLGMEASWR